MNQYQEIVAVMDRYFESIYQGDTDVLRSTFHPRATLSGEVSGQPYFKLLDEYLEVVKNRKSPKNCGEPFAMKTLAIEILDHIAFVKAHCPMLGFNYFDYLSLI
jgi:hypothetical protein